jgi:hypothetical protein
MELNKDLEKFVDEINSPDLLNIILRAHLYIESRLIYLIKERLHNPEALDFSKLNFPLKLKLCVALGVMESKELGAYLVLNELRNNIAHNLEPNIGRKEIEKFLSSLNNEQKKIYFIDKKEGDHIYNFRRGLAVLFVILNSRIQILREEDEILKDVLPILKDLNNEVRRKKYNKKKN